MKILSILLLCGVGLFSGFSPKTSKNISPKNEKTLVVEVKNGETNAPLAGVEVKFFDPKSDPEKLVATEKTGATGKISLKIPAGNFTVESRLTGFETLRLLNFSVAENKENQLVIRLRSAELDEVLVKNYRSENEYSESLSAGSASLGMAYSTAPRATGGEFRAAKKSEKVMMRSAPADAKSEVKSYSYVHDLNPDVRYDAKMEDKPASAADPVSPPPPVSKRKFTPPVVKKDEEVVEEKTVEMAVSETDEVRDGAVLDEISSGEPAKTSPTPRAGLLTAGEWNDLNNWKTHWLDLLADGEIDAHQKMYNFFPKNRYTVFLENETGFPAVDVPVRLLDGSKIVWETKTDNVGKAELWAGMFDAQAAVPQNLQIEAEILGKKINLGAAISTDREQKNSQRHTLKFECKTPKNVDIVWAVDATGSMGDEIEYLKTELLDVIGRVKNSNRDLDFRMGTVFYRDKDDEYLTKSSDLNYDIAKTVNFIKKQSAAGGGDYPEAVENALDEVVNRQSWSSDAVARICFLVLDASPHNTPEVNASLQKSIAAAAKKGIRIVPIAASGIQKDTEFLMKFFGLASNGTYIFLTDHSGIGGKHLEPTTDEYKVESLNDLLVRVITEFTSVKTCEGKSAIRFDENQQNGQGWQANYFPNPANAQFILELPVAVESLVLYDSEGKSMKKLTNLPIGQTIVPTADLPEGIYTMRILKDNEWKSGKVMVIHP